LLTYMLFVNVDRFMWITVHLGKLNLNCDTCGYLLGSGFVLFH